MLGDTMRIDLNNDDEFTVENVSKLLGSKTDSRNRQLRVTASGEAYLSDVVGSRETDGLALRLETWQAGNSYVGSEAANNAAFVQRIYHVLRQNWPNPTMSYIDIF